MKDDKKQKDFYAVVSAIVRFIEEADSGRKSSTPEYKAVSVKKERNDLIESRE